MKDIFGLVLTKSDKKISMACPSINTFGCESDVILDGIEERKVFYLYLCVFFYFIFGTGVHNMFCFPPLFIQINYPS
jgi:hypothetical protein